ncbi:MAG: alpha-amlyase [Alphaproteobacteria bacterium]|nr:MAG: alpha-amlyase [Alphaproteobacteria bacterium]
MRLCLFFVAVFCIIFAKPVLPTLAADPVLDRYTPEPYVKITHPDWSKNAILYQLNTRQFTPEGTFRAAEAQLPRLKALGVDIIWLMPIHPIGEMNRKGGLGSPYSVKDYFGVNPEFGTLEDLKHFVDTAHGLGLYVILDWVANHTAWDNPMRTEHPDWYERDYKGDFRPTPWWDWSDIIDLDYSQPGLREYMTRALKYWVAEVGIDGYRCDVAGFVPVDFWNNARAELDAIKPVFMLAEWESRDLHARAFDMTYAWSWWQDMHKIAHGKADLGSLFVYYSWNESAFPAEAFRMVYTSNHDVNAWEGTTDENFGDAFKAVTVLSVVGEGVPMIYNGQEGGLDRRLAFFDRDPIDWKPSAMEGFYKTLFSLKKRNTALWNGQWGARMVHVPNSVPSKVLSFVRANDTDKVFVAINFSAEKQTVALQETLFAGDYDELFSGEATSLRAGDSLDIEPWGYRVYVKRRDD